MNLQKTVLKYKLHHLIFWLILFALWFYLRYQDYSTIQKAATVTFIKVVDLALLIYICNYILVPKLLFAKKYVAFIFSFIALVVVSSFYKMQLIGWVINNPALTNLTDNLKGRIYDNLIPHFFLVTAGVAIKLIFDYLNLQKRLSEVAKEKAEAELNFLKSQINPHFLFNSINSVYFLIDKKNTEARDALLKFSDMLRYQLYECNGEKIPIEKELRFLEDYVALQQLRTNENTEIDLSYSSQVSNFTIEPLLLIPFVENSFKHLSHYSNGNQNKVKINITKQNGSMNFSVYNTTEGRKVYTNEPEGGIGLNNVKKRLELLYPKTHQLNIKEKEGWFGIELQLSIN